MMRRAISPRFATSSRRIMLCRTSHHIRKTPKAGRPPRIVHNGQTQTQDRARVARVDHPVVVEPAGEEQRRRLRLDLLLDHGAHGRVLVLVVDAALGLGGLPRHDRQHPGELGRTHHRRLRVRPREEEPGIVGPAAHAVVAGAVRGADVDGQVRHRRVRHRVDHQGAVLDDAVLLVLAAHHVAGGVLQEQQRRAAGVGELDELRRLLRLGGEQDAAGVGQHADRMAVHRTPAGDQRRAVQRLELVELAAVEHPGQDLARVERHPQVGRRDGEQVVDRVLRLRRRR